MRCDPPMPAQFISTRATPCAASAFASPALTCSSSVTSAWTATPFTSAATFSAFSMLWSSTAILAPLAAMARAVAAPRPEPPPVMRTATSFNCMIKNLSLGVSSGRGEWRVASGKNRHVSVRSIFPLFAIRYSLFAVYSLLLIRHFFATRHSLLPFSQHATADQRFHMPDVLATDFVGDRPDAGGARHRVPPEKQGVAGADQAGVEQHRIDVAELAAPDAFRQQPAMKVEQRRDKEF